MKRIGILALAAMVLTACSRTESVFDGSPVEEQTVTLTFSPYKMDAMTRTSVSIADIATRLDVWLYESGTEYAAYHQSSSDSDFGSLSVTLDKTKTYTLYAMAHKGTSPATLTSSVISFPDDKTTHSLYYTTIFSPSVTTSLTCEMTRIVAQFRLETTDAVPSTCKKIRISVPSVYDRWSVTDGPTHAVDKVSTISITSTANDGTVALNVYAITGDTQTLHTITVDALDESEETIQTRTFTDVPLRAGYRTTYRGTFFTDTPMTMTFTTNDWTYYETVNF